MLRIAPALALVLALASGAPAHPRGPARQDKSAAEDAIERWKHISPEERARIERRFEAWKQMDESQREVLRRRHERLRAAERTVDRELPAGARRCLEGLAPEERRALLREHLEGEFFERGRRMRGLLPEDVREKLESASPEERAKLLCELRRRFEGEGLARGLREVGRRLELAPEDVERLTSMPSALQRAKLLQLRRLEITRRVAREGLPAWIPAEQWAAWQGLTDEQFLERLHAARSRRWSERGELWRLLRPDPHWFEELAGLEPDALRAELQRRTAERVIENFAQHPEVVTPAELDELRALAPADALDRARERLRAAFGDRRDGRRDRRGGDGSPGDDCDDGDGDSAKGERDGPPRRREGRSAGLR
jgi:hypothetical protein